VYSMKTSLPPTVSLTDVLLLRTTEVIELGGRLKWPPVVLSHTMTALPASWPEATTRHADDKMAGVVESSSCKSQPQGLQSSC
jgi:hypothetical protein